MTIEAERGVHGASMYYSFLVCVYLKFAILKRLRRRKTE